MIIKTAILKSELDLVKDFLKGFDLTMPESLTKTFYIEDSGKIIGTISTDNDIIKCFALDNSYQGENLSSLLINHVISYFSESSIHSYTVYTKPMYKNVFLSFGFRLITETSKVVLLEGGALSITDELNKIRKQLEIFTNSNELEKLNISSIVMNANPITLGHEYLIEKASKESDYVVLFVVEEDKSIFSFKERLSYVYLVSHKYSNVIVLPSTKYIVSLTTFPNYFLKAEEIEFEYSLIDSKIFNDYFMKTLAIKKRYVGTESKDYMSTYNKALKDELKDKLVIVDRIKIDDEVVSASRVRALITNNNMEEALKYLPNEIKLFVRGKALNE